MEAVVCRCSKCGIETDWEEVLGPNPLCVVCWDSEADVVTLAERKALYREAHKAGIQAYNSRYREAHKAELQAYRRKFGITHCEYLRRSGHEYYLAHKAELQEYQVRYQRDYYQRNRARIILSRREYRKARSCSQGCKTEQSISVP